MTISALFSLIAAVLFGLLPVLLLAGRRIQRARRRGRESAAQDQGPLASDADLAPPGPSQTDRSILEKIVRGRRESVEREEMRRAGRTAATGTGLAPAGAGLAGTPPATATTRQSGPEAVARRLERLSPLQRAIVYREILGPPAALKQDGRTP